jgi:hypothetical protein
MGCSLSASGGAATAIVPAGTNPSLQGSIDIGGERRDVGVAVAGAGRAQRRIDHHPQPRRAEPLDMHRITVTVHHSRRARRSFSHETSTTQKMHFRRNSLTPCDWIWAECRRMPASCRLARMIGDCYLRKIEKQPNEVQTI